MDKKYIVRRKSSKRRSKDYNITSRYLKNSNRINNFLRIYGHDYGYNSTINEIRDKEYPQLRNQVYLDHSGSTTYARSVLTSFVNDLSVNLFGNPHSNNPSSQLSTIRVEEVRNLVLRHFNTTSKDYRVIFTPNTTGALRLVGDMVPWTPNKSWYRYLRESHNSLIGVRRLADLSGAQVHVTNEDELRILFDSDPDSFVAYNDDETVYNLFGYPAQCNFSGQRFPLDWVAKIKRFETKSSKILVLLDAAAYLSTSVLDLSDKDSSPDFVSLSFYKIFGFPTGLGALLVKSELYPILNKKYFGGGSTEMVAYDRTWQLFRKDMSEKYEDGTINFLDIIALGHAFKTHHSLYGDFTMIKKHVSSLTKYLYDEMNSLKHWNGTKVVEINASNDFSDYSKQGSVLSFNVRRSDGSWVGYNEIERRASLNGIHVRTGGHCNPGCIDKWIHVSPDDIIENSFACTSKGDLFHGGLTGAVRISLGAMSTIEDVLIWLKFLKRNHVETKPSFKRALKDSLKFN